MNRRLRSCQWQFYTELITTARRSTCSTTLKCWNTLEKDPSVISMNWMSLSPTLPSVVNAARPCAGRSTPAKMTCQCQWESCVNQCYWQCHQRPRACVSQCVHKFNFLLEVSCVLRLCWARPSPDPPQPPLHSTTYPRPHTSKPPSHSVNLNTDATGADLEISEDVDLPKYLTDFTERAP